jgi:hypothetical protein
MIECRLMAVVLDPEGFVAIVAVRLRQTTASDDDGLVRRRGCPVVASR